MFITKILHCPSYKPLVFWVAWVTCRELVFWENAAVVETSAKNSQAYF